MENHFSQKTLPVNKDQINKGQISGCIALPD
jgi:hypothetical protein